MKLFITQEKKKAWEFLEIVSEKAHSLLLNTLADRSQGKSKEFGLLGVCTTLKTATKFSITRALLQILLESALPATASVPFAVVTSSHSCPWDWQEPKQLWDFWSSISCSWNWLVGSRSVEKDRNTQNKERERERESTCIQTSLLLETKSLEWCWEETSKPKSLTTVTWGRIESRSTGYT